MNLGREGKARDIALSNPAPRQASEGAGLHYCCAGGQSLHESCLQAGASPEEIPDRLRQRQKQPP